MTETARKGSDDFFARRAAGLEWLLFDVDGVLTDGTLYYTRRGEAVKPFHVKDGLGLQLARRAGLRLGILSGRRSGAVERRAKDLGFEVVMLGSKDKAADFSKFLERQHTTPGRVAFVGDDLPDLPVLGRCALSFAPADAAAEVRAAVHRVLATLGGQGVAREMIEVLLEARGEWTEMVATFSFDG